MLFGLKHPSGSTRRYSFASVVQPPLHWLSYFINENVALISQGRRDRGMSPYDEGRAANSASFTATGTTGSRSDLTFDASSSSSTTARSPSVLKETTCLPEDTCSDKERNVSRSSLVSDPPFGDPTKARDPAIRMLRFANSQKNGGQATSILFVW
ncbi:hypothetical protein BT69DRAFT_1005926 [Atractiella rhizophila]|nr:hypothetical protein BT69DRAFT_1005926 [Atractiella rhizophila]